MDIIELKKEQLKLASKVVLRDSFTQVKLVGGADYFPVGDKILAAVVVCKYPSFEIVEKKTFLLDNPLPSRSEYLAYRVMPAIIEAFNELTEEPDVLFVRGDGINHPRKFGLASHLGLALQIPTLGVVTNNNVGNIENGKIMFENEIVGFAIKTREHANEIYVSPGHLMSLGSALQLVKDSVRFPHKMPEPLHIAHKLAKKKAKKMVEE